MFSGLMPACLQELVGPPFFKSGFPFIYLENKGAKIWTPYFVIGSLLGGFFENLEDVCFGMF